MASIGRNTNGSQFYVSFSPNKHFNGRCIVFGKLIEGEEVLKQIEAVSINLYLYMCDLLLYVFNIVLYCTNGSCQRN